MVIVSLILWISHVIFKTLWILCFYWDITVELYFFWRAQRILPVKSPKVFRKTKSTAWNINPWVRFDPYAFSVPRTTCKSTCIWNTLKKSFSCSLFFLVCSASIPFFACELKAVKPYRRGVFCGDPSITYPYIEREAIPDGLLIAGGIIITGLTVRAVRGTHTPPPPPPPTVFTALF